MNDVKIEFLMMEVAKYPALYNKVCNKLYKDFDIRGAEICLLITYIVHELGKEVNE